MDLASPYSCRWKRIQELFPRPHDPQKAAHDFSGVQHGDKRVGVHVAEQVQNLRHVLTVRDGVEDGNRAGASFTGHPCGAETRLAKLLHDLIHFLPCDDLEPCPAQGSLLLYGKA